MLIDGQRYVLNTLNLIITERQTQHDFTACKHLRREKNNDENMKKCDISFNFEILLLAAVVLIFDQHTHTTILFLWFSFENDIIPPNHHE